MINISNFITKINLANKKKLLFVEVDLNNKILYILWSLYKDGYISGFFVKKNSIIVYLKYIEGKSLFLHINQVSKISKRIYVKDIHKNMCKSDGVYLITTPQGIKITKQNIIMGEILLKFI